MVLAFRFRLYPDRKQEERLVAAIEACRRLWNLALADRKEAWEYERLSTTYEEQCLMLSVEKKTDPSLSAVYSQTLQDALKRLDGAFKAFFERRAGYPRFKYREYGSFTYPQAYSGSVGPDVMRKRLYLSKVGNVRMVFHRALPKDARLKTCTVVREPDGKWYAALLYDDVVPLQGVRIPDGWKSPAGIDLGLKAIVTTSDGEKVEPPNFLRKSEARLKRLQKDLSRKQKGSRNRDRARHGLARQHVQVANQRLDFNHKLSTKLVAEHDFIAIEDLRVNNMIRNHSLAKSISDAGWRQLVALVEYKAATRDVFFQKVPPEFTTQECDFCGALNQVPLDVREFECAGCHNILDRDVNAARIVLKRGLRLARNQVGRDTPELKPVETGPPLSGTGMSGGASPVVEAGTIRSGDHTAQFETPLLEAHDFGRGRMSLLPGASASLGLCSRHRSQHFGERSGNQNGRPGEVQAISLGTLARIRGGAVPRPARSLARRLVSIGLDDLA